MSKKISEMEPLAKQDFSGSLLVPVVDSSEANPSDRNKNATMDTLFGAAGLEPKPFNNFSVNADLRSAIKDFKVYGYEGSGRLYIARVDRQNGTTWRINLGVNEGTNVVLCQFTYSNYVERDGVQMVSSNTDLSGDGVTFDCWIDWSEMPTGATSTNVTSGELSTSVAQHLPAIESETDILAREGLSSAKSVRINNQMLARLQKITGDYNHIICYGQSLAISGGTPINTTPYKNSKMIGTDAWIRQATSKTALFDLVSGDGREPAGVQAVHAFKDLIDNYLHGVADKQFVYTSAGNGGTSIELLSKGVPAANFYEDEFLDALNSLKAIADGESKTVRCPLIIWMQGEANMTASANQNATGDGPATNDKEEYKELLTTLMDDMIADIKSVYGQESDPIILMYATKNNFGGMTAPIQMAQIEYCMENYNAYIFSPTYFLLTRESDTTHPTANGYRWLGEYVAKAVHKALLHERKPQWLGPREIVIGRNAEGYDYADIHFNVPVPPLRLNTQTWPAVTRSSRTTYGFAIYKDGVFANVTGADVFDTFVRVYPAKNVDLSTGVITVSYADSDSTPIYAGSGNLCDSDDFPSRGVFVSGDSADFRVPDYYDGSSVSDSPYPLYNWCPPFSYELNGVSRLVIE